jgi:hypothetical protein
MNIIFLRGVPTVLRLLFFSQRPLIDKICSLPLHLAASFTNYNTIKNPKILIKAQFEKLITILVVKILTQRLGILLTTAASIEALRISAPQYEDTTRAQSSRMDSAHETDEISLGTEITTASFSH